MALRVCSYEDRPDAMDGLVLMGESLCRADKEIVLHLTVPDAPPSVRTWAAGRPQVILTANRPAGVSGWDVKAWLLLQELDAGCEQALWLDSDMIVNQPVSRIVAEFPPGWFLVAEEWDSIQAEDVAGFWDVPPAHPVTPVNSCFVRATPAHRPLLQAWLQKTQDLKYREAQLMPFEQRPWRLASDQVLLTALLGSEAFCDIPFGSIRIGRHIAQCAGSSGYRAGDRLRDLFRGLPAMIHCIGRKPWTAAPELDAMQQFGLDFATDLSPYVLAARRVANQLNMHAEWLEARTTPGAILRGLTGGHPGLAGLPLAMAHAFYTGVMSKVRAKTA
ncbi:MAG: hypothetical protein M3N54_08235 [Acidobacteriota bacterium]|nr:hypothetical protein [Acidobacteriota bacterium]